MPSLDTDEASIARTRPDGTRKGIEIVGAFRRDALHEALARAQIENDTVRCWQHSPSSGSINESWA